MQTLNVIVIALYLAGVLLFGWWGRRRTVGISDFLVAGRRLGLRCTRGP